jgi:hypothetical protein
MFVRIEGKDLPDIKVSHLTRQKSLIFIHYISRMDGQDKKCIYGSGRKSSGKIPLRKLKKR